MTEILNNAQVGNELQPLGYIHIYKCIHLFIYIYVCMFTYIYIYVYIHILYLYVYTFAYIYSGELHEMVILPVKMRELMII